MCQNCKKHKGTDLWVGDRGVFGYAHGMSQSWCKCCILKAQIDYAELAVKRLKKLRKDLDVTKCG